MGTMQAEATEGRRQLLTLRRVSTFGLPGTTATSLMYLKTIWIGKRKTAKSLLN